jgi:hypothetical protein
MTLGGSNPAAFAVVANNCSGTLAAGASCTFGVTFAPQASGIATASVQLTANPGGTTTVGVRGNGLDPVLRIDLPSRHFGSVPLGRQSQYARFEVTNVSAAATAPLTAVIAGMHPNDFTIAAAANTCESVALAPGASCSVEVRFEPTAVQDRRARLTVAASASSAVADLTGAAGNASSLELTPTPVSFGEVPVGQPSAAQHFTITNHATSASLPLTISSTSSVFQISNDTCSNVMLASSASCGFDVTAYPTAPGLVAGFAGTFVYSGLIVRGTP